jgi:D-serine deaminase-like pyridoxal phosphate-dependent protein
MSLTTVPTPALVLDRGRLEQNCAAMSQRAAAAGVALRPHLKTAKSIEVARLATAGHPGGVTVSTLAEAAYFAERGVRDLTYAVCITPDKLDRVAALEQAGARIGLITDDPGVAAAVADRARALGARFRLLVEIDSGEHRTGVPAGDHEAIVAVARAIDAAPELELGGVLTHGGHSYFCDSVAAIEAVAEEERRAVVDAAAALRAAGLPCPTVSAGSTPTAVHGRRWDGVTELRPGVYTFFDLAQLGRGCCEASDLALSVLATVIGHQRGAGRLLLDAGALALSKDTSAAARLPDAGYGWVCDLDGERLADLRVAGVDQEHGYVEGAIPFDRLPVGTRVRVLPNHACLTAACHDRYQVLHGTEVMATWDRCRGW